MIEEDSKLLAILKSFEGAEHAVLRERSALYEVFERREKALKQAQERMGKLHARLQQLRGPGRFSALNHGELGSVRTGALFGARLEAELKGLESEVSTLAEDVRRVHERVVLVDEELIQARQDRKRIEVLLENRKQARRIVGAQVEEVQLEELHRLRTREKR